jgi:hypothetical protein
MSSDYYTPLVYTDAVQYVKPSEVYGWEHGDTYDALVDVAKEGKWEEYNIPPAEVVHFPNGVTKDLPNVHYVIVNGHHRHNAAHQAGGKFPVLPVDVGKKGRDGYAESAMRYHGRGGYDPKFNPYKAMKDKSPEWNADGVPTKHILKESTTISDYWDDMFKVEALRDPGILESSIYDLLHDKAYKLGRKKVDKIDLQIGSSVYDHAASGKSTSFDYVTISYSGDKEHPDNIDDLLEHGRVKVGSRSFKAKDVANKPIYDLLPKKARRETPHEIELGINVDLY